MTAQSATDTKVVSIDKAAEAKASKRDKALRAWGSTYEAFRAKAAEGMEATFGSFRNITKTMIAPTIAAIGGMLANMQDSTPTERRKAVADLFAPYMGDENKTTRRVFVEKSKNKDGKSYDLSRAPRAVGLTPQWIRVYDFLGTIQAAVTVVDNIVTHNMALMDPTGKLVWNAKGQDVRPHDSPATIAFKESGLVTIGDRQYAEPAVALNDGHGLDAVFAAFRSVVNPVVDYEATALKLYSDRTNKTHMAAGLDAAMSARVNLRKAVLFDANQKPITKPRYAAKVGQHDGLLHGYLVGLLAQGIANGLLKIETDGDGNIVLPESLQATITEAMKLAPKLKVDRKDTKERAENAE